MDPQAQAPVSDERETSSDYREPLSFFDPSEEYPHGGGSQGDLALSQYPSTQVPCDPARTLLPRVPLLSAIQYGAANVDNILPPPTIEPSPPQLDRSSSISDYLDGFTIPCFDRIWKDLVRVSNIGKDGSKARPMFNRGNTYAKARYNGRSYAKQSGDENTPTPPPRVKLNRQKTDISTGWAIRLWGFQSGTDWEEGSCRIYFGERLLSSFRPSLGFEHRPGDELSPLAFHFESSSNHVGMSSSPPTHSHAWLPMHVQLMNV